LFEELGTGARDWEDPVVVTPEGAGGLSFKNPQADSEKKRMSRVKEAMDLCKNNFLIYNPL
jgi:hypothetical protein